MQKGDIELKIGKKQFGMSIWALGDRFNDHIKVIYTDITLGKKGPLIIHIIHDNIVCSEDVEKLNLAREMGRDPIIQPSAIYGSCGITMNHFVDDLPRVSKNH